MDRTMQQLLRRISALEQRLDRLVSNDTADIIEWTAWTPELYGTSVAGTITYTTQDGWYAVVNDIVFVFGQINVNTITVAPTGSLRIRTLPYSSSGITAMNIMGRANLSASYTRLGARTGTGSDFLIMTEMGDDLNQNYPAGNLNTNFSVQFSGFYQTT